MYHFLLKSIWKPSLSSEKWKKNTALITIVEVKNLAPLTWTTPPLWTGCFHYSRGQAFTHPSNWEISLLGHCSYPVLWGHIPWGCMYAFPGRPEPVTGINHWTSIAWGTHYLFLCSVPLHGFRVEHFSNVVSLLRLYLHSCVASSQPVLLAYASRSLAYPIVS